MNGSSAVIVAGAADVYAAIEGPHAWGTAHVARASTTTVDYAGITYLALKLAGVLDVH